MAKKTSSRKTVTKKTAVRKAKPRRLMQKELKAFKEVDNWSKSIHGLGPVITKKVRKVLNAEFRENKDY